MKYYELDEYENKVLEAYEKSKVKSVPNAKKEISRYTRM